MKIEKCEKEIMQNEFNEKLGDPNNQSESEKRRIMNFNNAVDESEAEK